MPADSLPAPVLTKLPSGGFGPIIAEDPYDQMGQDFRDIFGRWVDATAARDPVSGGPHPLHLLTFDLFSRRLELARKYRTFFSTQVVQGDRELWRERFRGATDGHAYSFAIRELPRTARFYRWCAKVATQSNDVRRWDLGLKPYPSLPLGPYEFYPVMEVWSHRYVPRFQARRGGPLHLRRILMHPDVYLIEHPDHRWVPMLRQEAAENYARALDAKRPFVERADYLAHFEWLWFWLNPFGRAGALTGDALSLIAQKQMVLDGHSVGIRPGYYHQDCEAFLLSAEAYQLKRLRDMTSGFSPCFEWD